jgi:hypothetical protein
MKINRDLNLKNEHMRLGKSAEMPQGLTAYIRLAIGKLRERIRRIGLQPAPDQFVRVTEKFDVVHRINQHRK